ncbi:NAD(P)-dependent alcohol dehydrogenase [Paenibacillus radicis (ex Gao et al. 2016)]|uniref:Alcohol dehydrogenase n=1 Tax=Paenibacillus radicis (ex Gao et al. 2016) TaxID=1737354 RepID=A0A917GYI9_9BACL|nr:NAD(P)-dependent alcohol dehydrogenase [Paenibacillus radicis (ex Gao et al. 2016)]GGG61811.1 alcohol dehydrogenase [Paenibacillus radicis (ex Gao et al. 2016)]
MINRAAFMTGLNKLEIREVPVPELKASEVLVKLDYVGICGSDVHYLEHGKIGDFVVNGDFILGHECAGTIVAVGSDVRQLKTGDRVALEPGATCGKCEFCISGRYNLCPDVQFLATPPFHGCFANYIAFPANLAFKLPDSISNKEGALIEPLSVGMHAAKQGSVTLGSSVVILGAGCIGLTALLASKAYGALDITVVDVIQKRLDKALELGATRVINAAQEDVLEQISELTGGEGVDIVMETAGAVRTTQQTPHLVKRGGTIVLVGMPPQDIIEFNFAKLLSKEAEIKTVFRYRNIYPQAIKAIAEGVIDVSGIVTHEYGFDDIAEAFDVNINRKNEVVKIVVKID